MLLKPVQDFLTQTSSLVIRLYPHALYFNNSLADRAKRSHGNEFAIKFADQEDPARRHIGSPYIFKVIIPWSSTKVNACGLQGYPVKFSNTITVLVPVIAELQHLWSV